MRDNLIRRLFNVLNKDKILYCNWKSTNHLSVSFCGDTDFDVLACRYHRAELESVLNEIGFVEFNTTALRRYPGVVDYIGYCSDLKKMVHLHLHYQLVLGDRWVKAFRIPIESKILNRRTWSGDFNTWIISPEDELLMFLARMPLKLKHPFASGKIISELKYLVVRCNQLASSDLSTFREYPISVVDCASEALAKDDLSDLGSYATKIRRDMVVYRRMSLINFYLLSVIRYFYRLYVEFKKRVFFINSIGRRDVRTGGLSVAFVGIDGAGKSSALLRLKSFFSAQMNVESVSLGAGKSGASTIRNIAFKILGAKAKFSAHKKISKSRLTDEGGLESLCYPWYYIVWNLIISLERISRLLKIHRIRSEGALVLVDRWPQSSIPNGPDAPRLSGLFSKGLNWITRIESKVYEMTALFPPDLIFIMKISPETSLARKPGELTYEQAFNACQSLDLVAWPKGSKVYVIDCDKPLSDVDAILKTVIFKVMEGRSEIL